jgi:Cu+-exporting ATPase
MSEMADRALVKTVIKINGMTCANCAANIEKTLSKLPGIYKASVNFASEKAIVEYSDDEIRPAAIIETIAELGFKPVVLQSSFNVGGMTLRFLCQRVAKVNYECAGVGVGQRYLQKRAGTVSYLER